jgi:hypothetical protein
MVRGRNPSAVTKHPVKPGLGTKKRKGALLHKKQIRRTVGITPAKNLLNPMGNGARRYVARRALHTPHHARMSLHNPGVYGSAGPTEMVSTPLGRSTRGRRTG